nr:MAG TPA: hypothetical protein [Caudoviricetes sp.]
MLVKKIAIERVFEDGFDNKNSKITVSLIDLDRDIIIKTGDSVTDRMDFQIKGVILGLNMAGYQVVTESITEIDNITKLTRKVKQ